MEAWIKKSCLTLVYLASVLLILIVLVTVYNIGAFGLDRLLRPYGYSIEGLSGYEDFVRLAISCVALMYFPWTQFERGHVSVDFFSQKLSNTVQVVLDKTWLFITFCFVIFLAIFMYKGMIESYEDGAVSSILEWSIWPFYIPGIISLALWGVVLIYQIIFKDRRRINA